MNPAVRAAAVTLALLSAPTHQLLAQTVIGPVAGGSPSRAVVVLAPGLGDGAGPGTLLDAVSNDIIVGMGRLSHKKWQNRENRGGEGGVGAVPGRSLWHRRGRPR